MVGFHWGIKMLTNIYGTYTEWNFSIFRSFYTATTTTKPNKQMDLFHICALLWGIKLLEVEMQQSLWPTVLMNDLENKKIQNGRWMCGVKFEFSSPFCCPLHRNVLCVYRKMNRILNILTTEHHNLVQCVSHWSIGQ